MAEEARVGIEFAIENMREALEQIGQLQSAISRLGQVTVSPYNPDLGAPGVQQQTSMSLAPGTVGTPYDAPGAKAGIDSPGQGNSSPWGNGPVNITINRVESLEVRAAAVVNIYGGGGGPTTGVGAGGSGIANLNLRDLLPPDVLVAAAGQILSTRVDISQLQLDSMRARAAAGESIGGGVTFHAARYADPSLRAETANRILLLKEEQERIRTEALQQREERRQEAEQQRREEAARRLQDARGSETDRYFGRQYEEYRRRHTAEYGPDSVMSRGEWTQFHYERWQRAYQEGDERSFVEWMGGPAPPGSQRSGRNDFLNQLFPGLAGLRSMGTAAVIGYGVHEIGNSLMAAYGDPFLSGRARSAQEKGSAGEGVLAQIPILGILAKAAKSDLDYIQGMIAGGQSFAAAGGDVSQWWNVYNQVERTAGRGTALTEMSLLNALGHVPGAAGNFQVSEAIINRIKQRIGPGRGESEYMAGVQNVAGFLQSAWTNPTLARMFSENPELMATSPVAYTTMANLAVMQGSPQALIGVKNTAGYMIGNTMNWDRLLKESARVQELTTVSQIRGLDVASAGLDVQLAQATHRGSSAVIGALGSQRGAIGEQRAAIGERLQILRQRLAVNPNDVQAQLLVRQLEYEDQGLAVQEKTIPFTQADTWYQGRMAIAGADTARGQARLSYLEGMGYTPGEESGRAWSRMRTGLEEQIEADRGLLQRYRRLGVTSREVLDPIRARIEQGESQLGTLPIRRIEWDYRQREAVTQAGIGGGQARLQSADLTSFYGEAQEEAYGTIQEGLKDHLQNLTTKLKELWRAGAKEADTAPVEAEIERAKASIRQSVIQQYRQQYEDTRQQIGIGQQIVGQQIAGYQQAGILPTVETVGGLMQTRRESITAQKENAWAEYEAALRNNDRKGALLALQKFQGYEIQERLQPLQDIQEWYQPYMRAYGTLQTGAATRIQTELQMGVLPGSSPEVMRGFGLQREIDSAQLQAAFAQLEQIRATPGGRGSQREFEAELQYEQAQQQARLRPLQQLQQYYRTYEELISNTGAMYGAQTGTALARGAGGLETLPQQEAQSRALRQEISLLRQQRAQAAGTPGVDRGVLQQYDTRIAQAEQASEQFEASRGNVPLPVEMRERRSQTGYELQVLSMMPGSYGDIRGAFQRRVREIQEEAHYLQEYAQRADLNPEARAGVNQRLRELGVEQAQAVMQASQGWQSRLISEVVGARGQNFGLVASQFALRDAVGAGVFSPQMGSRSAGQNLFFMEQAGLIRRPGGVPGFRGPWGDSSGLLPTSAGRTGIFGLELPGLLSSPDSEGRDAGRLSVPSGVPIFDPQASGRSVPRAPAMPLLGPGGGAGTSAPQKFEFTLHVMLQWPNGAPAGQITKTIPADPLAVTGGLGTNLGHTGSLFGPQQK